jgi:large subunit ribosomal protein L25
MTTTATQLTAEARQDTGKGPARLLRRQGKLPGIMYGAGIEPIKIAIGQHEFSQVLRRPGFFAHVVELTLGNEKHRVLPRALQRNPVTDIPEHVDFLRITDAAEVHVMVRVLFKNREKSPGLKRGGTLNIVRRELELLCTSDHIPEVIEIDLAGTNIGQSIHISHIPLPQGVRPAISDRDFTVAAIVGRRGQKEDEDATPAAAAAAAPAAGANAAAAPAKGAAPAKDAKAAPAAKAPAAKK